uniref:N-acetyltransferase domain-containing protein n=1 Tax=Parastrongyloides trichosuri TaxID=131310 RepID=A0A0N4ZZN8_PARTI
MQGLAEHEGYTAYLAATPDSLALALSTQPPRAAVLLAEREGRAVGFVSWTRVYGIWRGGDYLNLDDLFVADGARCAGVGEALMRAFATEAAAEGLGARLRGHVVRRFFQSVAHPDRIADRRRHRPDPAGAGRRHPVECCGSTAGRDAAGRHAGRTEPQGRRGLARALSGRGSGRAEASRAARA